MEIRYSSGDGVNLFHLSGELTVMVPHSYDTIMFCDGMFIALEFMRRTEKSMTIHNAAAIDTLASGLSTRPKRSVQLRRFLGAWELYVILLLAAFTHFYGDGTAIFQYDEPNVFRFSREAITHGFIPLTSNTSSLSNLNPPLMVYLGMIPAAFSANPLWAQVLVAFCNFLAVLLTYVFVRRYYGRLAGGIAGLLYTTAVAPLVYSRSFWPQNLLPFFSMLFLLVVFRGIIERRRNWFVPATLLIAMAYQLHGTAVFLLIPLGLAVIFAWRTLRVRDGIWAGVSVSLLFSPYLYWVFKSQFYDLHILLNASRGPAVTNMDSLRWYLSFLNTYVRNSIWQDPILPDDPRSLLVSSPLHYLVPLLEIVQQIMPYLLLGGILSAVVQVLWPSRTYPANSTTAHKSVWQRWLHFWSNPYRQGLVLLLSWQVIPPLLLLRHSLPIYVHYFIYAVPGQFILIALFLASLVRIVRDYQPRWHIPTQLVIGTIACALILAQFTGTFTQLYDTTHGHFDPSSPSHFYGNVDDLNRAIKATDDLAQQRHSKHIYISTFFSLSQAMYEYAEEMKTPTSVFQNEWGCMVLPGLETGPVVFLSLGGTPFDDGFLAAYTNATLVETSPRLSGAPFRLYIVTAKPTPAPVAQSSAAGIQLLSDRAHLVSSIDRKQQWLTTRWRVMNTAALALRTAYHLDVQYQTRPAGPWGGTARCEANALQAGDQLLTFTQNNNKDNVPATLQVQAETFKEMPVKYQSLFNIWLVSQKTTESTHQAFRTASGKSTLTLPVSNTTP